MEVLTDITAGAAVVAAGAGVWTLFVARSTRTLTTRDVKLSEKALAKSTEAVDIATTSSAELRGERLHQRLIAIGHLVEEVGVATGPKRDPTFTGQEWRSPCAKLGHALVGLEVDLSACNALASSLTRPAAGAAVDAARAEVARALSG